VRYVEASCLADHAGQELRCGAVVDGKPSPWLVVLEKCQRAMVALSMRLRLSPQARSPRRVRAPEHEVAPRARGGNMLGISYADMAGYEDE
jgi:hypothetical protein